MWTNAEHRCLDEDVYRSHNFEYHNSVQFYRGLVLYGFGLDFDR